MVFYLKVNRRVEYTIRNLQHWINTVMRFPNVKYFILCDNEELKDEILDKIDFQGSIPQFLKSYRNGQYDELLSRVAIKKWYNAAAAHLTTFVHAKENGFNRFWNIDADDTVFCLSYERQKELLMNAENYAENHSIDLFSLDMWRSRAQSMHGDHWSFGVTYTNGQVNWMEMIDKYSRCIEPSLLFVHGRYPKNIDEFFTFIKEKEKSVRIETFYYENLLFIHYSDDLIMNPVISGLIKWKEKKVLFPILYNIYGTRSLGLIPVGNDVIKLDIGITDYEGQLFLAMASKFTTESINLINAEEFANDFDKVAYKQMEKKVNLLDKDEVLKDKVIYIFGHSKYTYDLIRLLKEKGYSVKKIFDNNIKKQAKICNGVEVVSPDFIKGATEEKTEIIVAVKYFEMVCMQLRELGFSKMPIRLLNYYKILED